MPITNRNKSDNSTVVGGQVVPTINQTAVLTARSALPNNSPHGGSPASQSPSTKADMLSPIISRAKTGSGTSTVGSMLNQAGNVIRGLSSVAQQGAAVAGSVSQIVGAVKKVNSIEGAINAGSNIARAAENLVGGTTALISKGASAISGVVSSLGGLISGKDGSNQNPVSAVQQVASAVGKGGTSNPMANLTGGVGPALTSLQRTNNQQLMGALSGSGGGGSSSSHEIKYRIILNFGTADSYDDIELFIAERFGFIKSCPIYLVKMNVPPLLYEKLLQDQMKNIGTSISVKIYQVDTQNNNRLKQLIITRNFEMLYVKREKEATPEKTESTTISFLMANPTLIKMDRQYTYNSRHELTTAYGVISSYEGHITSIYGDNFVSKHVGLQVNGYIYEQIVTQPSDQEIELPNRAKFRYHCQHDIDIPLFIQYKYKASNSFALYFFDDFDLKISPKKEIARFFISYGGPGGLEKFQTETQQDIQVQSQLTGSFQFRDVTELLSLPSIETSKLINLKYNAIKLPLSGNIKGKTVKIGEVYSSAGDPTRKFFALSSFEMGHLIPMKKMQDTKQVPDAPGMAAARKAVASSMFSGSIDQLDCFLTKYCGMEYMRFGVVYAMNSKKPRQFLHSPVAIVNIFRRENAHETVLTHSVRTLMVKFKG